jgi:carbon-monoxide dehydrogenase medium subunit
MTAPQYERPNTIDGVVSLLAENSGDAALLAGGTDLLAQMRSRLVRPGLLVDVKGVEELRRLEQTDAGLSIGAAVILNRILEEQDRPELAALVQAVGELASYPIRNRATLVGNVTNASPCADTVPPLCAMGASVELQGPRGSRRIPVVEYITGNRETRRAADEVATQVTVPPLSRGTWSGFRKRKRVRGHDLALASVALLRDPERRRLRLAVGSCTPQPCLVELDDMYDRPDVDEANRRVQDGIHPIDDVRASIEYRRDMVEVMIRRLFVEMRG